MRYPKVSSFSELEPEPELELDSENSAVIPRFILTTNEVVSFLVVLELEVFEVDVDAVFAVVVVAFVVEVVVVVVFAVEEVFFLL